MSLCAGVVVPESKRGTPSPRVCDERGRGAALLTPSGVECEVKPSSARVM